MPISYQNLQKTNMFMPKLHCKFKFQHSELEKSIKNRQKPSKTWKKRQKRMNLKDGGNGRRERVGRRETQTVRECGESEETADSWCTILLMLTIWREWSFCGHWKNENKKKSDDWRAFDAFFKKSILVVFFVKNGSKITEIFRLCEKIAFFSRNWEKTGLKALRNTKIG